MKKFELSQRIRAGIAQARQAGSPHGRPRIVPPNWDEVMNAWDGQNYRGLAQALGTTLGTTHRLVRRWKQGL